MDFRGVGDREINKKVAPRMARRLNKQEHLLQVQILSTDGNGWTWPCMLVGPVLQGERQETSGTCWPTCERPCLKGLRQTVTDQDTSVLLWPLHRHMLHTHARSHREEMPPRCGQYGLETKHSKKQNSSTQLWTEAPERRTR